MSEAPVTLRRVKIVATLGPSLNSKELLVEAVRSGLNVARLNFSHGTHADHGQSVRWLREIAKERRNPIAIVQDLQGPKVRVGQFENGSIELVAGENVTITTRPVIGKGKLIPSDFPELAQSVFPGAKILLDDGRMELKVLSVQGTEIECEVIFGGILKNRKGMNCPGVSLRVEALTEKDIKDLEFGVAQGVDYVAMSFVRTGTDIRKLKDRIEQLGGSAKVIAKIEMREAVEDLEEICRLSDAIMVARGDLAVEVQQEKLPGIQKRIIRLCNELGKPVITATQMLESMIDEPTPTRAEITDVANAVWDGTDAVMLSAETANGKYPLQCLRTMHRIITEVETQLPYYKISLEKDFLSIPAALAASTSMSALKLGASVIVCLTTTGKTAQMISSLRPQARIVAVTDQISVLNRLELLWGVHTFPIASYKSLSDVIHEVQKLLLQNRLAKTGDRVVMSLGLPVEQGAKTNSLHVFHLE